MNTQNKDRDNGDVILFPYSSLHEIELKKILSFFESISIFHPWHLKSRIPQDLLSQKSLIHFFHPSEELKPVANFNSILIDFKNWLLNNKDKGYRDFLIVQSESESHEGTTWGIRELLRKIGHDSTQLKNENSLKWHLILHLAEEFEKHHKDMDNALKTLKNAESPLKGAVEDDEGYDLLKDISMFDSTTVMQSSQISNLVEAWFGPFNNQINPNELLITTHPYIVEFINNLSDTIYEKNENADIDQNDIDISFLYPDFSHYSIADLIKYKNDLLKDVNTNNLYDAVISIKDSNHIDIKQISDLIDEAESQLLTNYSGNILKITIKYFNAFKNSNQRGGEESYPNIFQKRHLYCWKMPDMIEKQLNNIEKLESYGWTRQFIANEPRLSEAVSTYKEIGFEVHLEPLPKEPECTVCNGEEKEKECQICFEGVEDQYKIIYTRPKKGKKRISR